jgi:hypothetical protein
MPVYQILHGSKLYFTDAPTIEEAHRIAVANLGAGEIVVTEIVCAKREPDSPRQESSDG